MKTILVLALFGFRILAYDVPCPYSEKDFPLKTFAPDFRMPLSPESTLIVYPVSCRKEAEIFQAGLKKKTGVELKMKSGAEAAVSEDGDMNLVVIGNLMNNPLMAEAYKKRASFYDADLPGKGGWGVHTAPSPFAPGKRLLLIGFSNDSDAGGALEAGLAEIPPKARGVGSVRRLKSALPFPAPLPSDSLDRLFAPSMANPEGVMPPYGAIADAGIYYLLTGDTAYASAFKRGFRLILDRARAAKDWVPERWTFVYFDLSRLILAWRNIEEDPVFSAADRELVCRVLWGLGRFVMTGPVYLRPEWLPEGEMRQNHPLFLAFSQYMIRGYFRDRFGRTDFEAMVPFYTRAFEGQEFHYLPNDNAYGYLTLATTYCATWCLHAGRTAFLDQGVKAASADGFIAATDNLRNMVTFGDAGTFSPAAKSGFVTHQTLSMAAWAGRDGAYQWIYRWLTEGAYPIDGRGLSLGTYVSDVAPAAPSRFCGLFVVRADTGVLRWAASRSSRACDIADPGRSYLDKMTMRRAFDADAEYLTVTGLSTLAHSHYDGNTIPRLTWRNRIWLFDMDQFQPHVKRHNGVTITRNGESGDVPPLTELVSTHEDDSMAFTATRLNDYAGADWTRYIVWLKGGWFVILDRVVALEPGDYRLNCRFRSRGEASLKGGLWSVAQGGYSMRLYVADDAQRNLSNEPDDIKRNWKAYPYGHDTEILDRIKEKSFAPGESYDFATLIRVEESGKPVSASLARLGAGLYRVEVAGKRGLIALPGIAGNSGQAAAWLEDAGSAPAVELRPDRRRRFVDFGFFLVKDLPLPAGISASASYNGGIILGDSSGGLFRLSGDSIAPFARLPQAFPVGFLGSLDLDGRQGEELVVSCLTSTGGGTEKAKKKDISDVTSISGKAGAAEVYCYDMKGGLRWKNTLVPNYDNALVTAIDAIRGKGGRAVTLVLATNGWKMFGLSPSDGKILFEPFVKYHRLTGLKVLEERGQWRIIPGTEYITPLSVFNAKGKEIWHAWEQMGSESKAKTEYMGYHLTAMDFQDVDSDREKEILFSTKNDRVYAVEAKDGGLAWQANVGDEALCLVALDTSRNNGPVSVTGTAAGDIVLLDRLGKRLGRISLGSAVVSLQKAASPMPGRTDMAALLSDGRVVIVDDLLKLRGHYDPGFPVRRLVTLNAPKGEVRLGLVGGDRIRIIRHTPSLRWECRYY